MRRTPLILPALPPLRLVSMPDPLLAFSSLTTGSTSNLCRGYHSQEEVLPFILADLTLPEPYMDDRGSSVIPLLRLAC